jgi:hypothetical protein
MPVLRLKVGKRARSVNYKIFSVNQSNQILARHYRALPDDPRALELATKLAAKTGCEVEVWEGQRFVARVDNDGGASEQRTISA